MTTISLAQPDIIQPGRLTLLLRYLRRNKSLAVGLFILLLLVVFTLYGLATADLTHAYPITVKSKQPPSLEFPLGTDFFGRDLYVGMVVGLKQTAIIGLLASPGYVIGCDIGFYLRLLWRLVGPDYQRHLSNPHTDPSPFDSGHYCRFAG